MATPRGYKPVPGSERPQVPGSQEIETIGRSEEVAFTMLVRGRPGSPDLPGFEHWHETSPSQRRFVSVEEFIGEFASAGEDFAALTAYLEEKGLRVLEADPGRRRVVAAGTAAKVNTAFAITLKRFRAPHHFVGRRLPVSKDGEPKVHEVQEHVYRGFEGPVQLPAALAQIVTAVIGLDSRRLGGPAGVGAGDPPGAGPLLPTQVAQLYDFPQNSAADQTIGLFAAADEGSAYLPSDITQFIAALPAGYTTDPAVTPVGLTVGLTTYGNDTSLITGGSPSGAAYETTQDIETSAATGQGANINVYFTENSEAGWEAFLSRAILPLAGDKQPSVLSASWVLYFSDDAATIGNPSTSGSFAHVVSSYLQLAAWRGITALIAIGDWGSANQVVDGHSHVGFPNSDPWFTACGGTIIGDLGATLPATFEEFAWSDANTGSQFDLGIYDATGGGVSDNFHVPHYQARSGVWPISKNDGKPRRGVPDVAGMVGMTGFVIDGGGYSFTGTSCVAPLYAGLIATINALLEHSVGFLNPTLYRHGSQICRDVTFGNNDSGVVPDAPFYVAGPEWDPCTGWGSINGLRLLAALAPAPILNTVVVAGGDFGGACQGGFVDQLLTINNSGFSQLLISEITSSDPDFAIPDISSYPIAVAPGNSIDLVIRFSPSSVGVEGTTLTITSNDILGPQSLSPTSGDLFGPHTISLSGTGGAPRLVVAIAGNGNFGDACVGSFVDEPLLINNAGKCSLEISGIASSSAEFLLPEVLSYPIDVAAGTSLALPLRFAPTSFGHKSATLTVASNDPGGTRTIGVSGDAPTGRLAVTGSTCFGGVKACSCAERTISVCNVGRCELKVTSVAFKRKNPHWALVNNPFPASLHAGSCLSVVIRYKADEKCPRACEIVIESDDPVTPVKTLDVMAYTIWGACGCGKEHCGGCAQQICGSCESGCCCDDCCEDE